MRRDLAHKQAAGRNQHLLVGKSNDASLPHRSQGRLEPGGPDNSSHDPVSRPLGCFDERRATACHFDPGAGKCLLQRRIVGRIGNHRETRIESSRLFGQQSGVVVRGQRFDNEQITVAQQQIDRAAPD